MVKGVSKQVIVVHSPDPKLFEQAIFILKEDAKGISNDALMKEASALMNSGTGNKRRLRYYGPLWACGGAVLTGLCWLISCLI